MTGTPAPGYRHPYYGALYAVGIHGYSWSSTVTSSYGYFLDFGYDWVNPNDDSHRSYGFQLRCLQE